MIGFVKVKMNSANFWCRLGLILMAVGGAIEVQGNIAAVGELVQMHQLQPRQLHVQGELEDLLLSSHRGENLPKRTLTSVVRQFENERESGTNRLTDEQFLHYLALSESNKVYNNNVDGLLPDVIRNGGGQNKNHGNRINQKIKDKIVGIEIFQDFMTDLFDAKKKFMRSFGKYLSNRGGRVLPLAGVGVVAGILLYHFFPLLKNSRERFPTYTYARIDPVYGRSNGIWANSYQDHGNEYSSEYGSSGLPVYYGHKILEQIESFENWVNKPDRVNKYLDQQI